MTDTIQSIPLEAIDADALPRDRAALDETALGELRHSIIVSGLRLPIEVYEFANSDTVPNGTEPRYGLISGYRRLAVFRGLVDAGEEYYASIPALIRDVDSRAAAYVAMIEENEIRAELSPWEKGLAAATAVESDFFPNIEEAVDRLYPAANSVKRSRIRAVARLAWDIDHLLTAPQTLSQKQLLRLAAAMRTSFSEPIVAALSSGIVRNPTSQWAAILPLIEEHEVEAAAPPPPATRPGRPRRAVALRRTLTVRRERTQEGYVLRFSGPESLTRKGIRDSNTLRGAW